MKILILAQSYPSQDNPYAMSYVHSRNVEYSKLEHNVLVVSFTAEKEYIYENIQVSPFKEKLIEEADIILAHAPNIKNHFRYLKKLKNKKICFFFHGHEVLKQYGDYPQPYSWNQKSAIKKIMVQLYDALKVKLVGKFLKKMNHNNDLGFIFVSDWMKKQFIKNIKLRPEDIGQSAVISNACNHVFLEEIYDFNQLEEKADFITIRPLDDSKYAIDLVIEFAKNNPEYTFHIYGKGRYFEHNQKPDNVEVINSFISQKDIPSLLNKYKCALMPTKYDAQGVMVCEMATFGMPVITSDFEVCVEMLDNFNNVAFLSEAEFSSLKYEQINISECGVKNQKFSSKKLVEEELAFFDKL